MEMKDKFMSQWTFEGKELTTDEANEMRENKEDFMSDVNTQTIKRIIKDNPMEFMDKLLEDKE